MNTQIASMIITDDQGHWIEGDVKMGRFDEGQPSDLRLYTHANKITLQLRHGGWYMCRTLTPTEAAELISTLATELAKLKPE